MMRRLREKQQEAIDKEDRDFRERWKRIDKEQRTFVPAVNEYFKLRAEDKTRRQREMHKAWETAVFDQISDQVQDALAARFAGDPSARWITAQDQYLEAFKRKEGNLFRDIIIADEYDPMVCAMRGLKYREERVGNDPMKAELLAAEKERATLPGSFKAPQHLSRETLDPTMWNRLDVTPWGDRMLNPKTAHPSAMHNQRGHIVLDHYSYPQGKAAMHAELPKGKRQFDHVKR